jgi:Ca2+-binding EF-hand superfamily protein
MSSISSIGGTNGMAMMQGMRNMRKPDPAEMADDLFSKLDTSGQGYIEKADLQTAFDSISTGTDSTTDVDSIFSQLDGDSDGKVTKQELTDKLQQLADQLDEQFQSMRMQQGMAAGGMGGMPPPPQNDTGFTQDELTSQLEEIGDSDSTRATLISSIVENFDTADADGDGKVTGSEAMSYAETAGIATGAPNGGAAPMGGMPPPPPPGDDTGFTQDELSAQLEEIGGTDSTRASLISSIVENFEAADSDGDGKVSFQEAMAYQESTGTTDTATATDSGSSTAAADTDSKVMLQIMRLMQAYNLKDGAASSVSVTA